MNRPKSTAYDSYNAKWISPDDVARTFIAPPQFGRLLKQRNTLVVGPRGSGKTTLLKMLTEPALRRWTGKNAEEFRSQISYTGVFIATDVSWNSQVTALGDQGLGTALRHLLQMAALTAHTHKALVDAMDDRFTALTSGLHRDVQCESLICGQLARIWKLDPLILSFFSLKSAIRLRLQRVHELALMARHADSRSANDLRRSSFLAIPLLVSSRNAVEVFNDAMQSPNHCWAFLFDELELMPGKLREELYRHLRTFPGPVIFKLALSPYDDDIPTLESQTGPRKDDDYDFIPLWYPKKRKAYIFCRDLWHGMLSKTPLAGKRPEEVLGRSLLDTESEEWTKLGTAYTRQSSHYRYLRELSEKDPSFRGYLASHRIDLERIEQVKGTDRASTLRKVFPLVVARVERRRTLDIRDTDSPAGKLRSRKVSRLYTGASAIFDICEGNPRRFIGLVGRLLERLPDRGERVDVTAQADEVGQAVSRFRAMLRTVLIPGTVASHLGKGLLSLLDPIGERLRDATLLGEFSPEPPATFVVDSSVDDATIELIGLAVNSGAIVHVPERDGGEDFLSSKRVRQQRFRLSYLLASHYGIPPRLGRSIGLGEIFNLTDAGPLLFPDEATS